MDQERVHELIRAVLHAAGDFDGKSELLDQVERTVATGTPTWLNLSVDPGSAPSPVSVNPVPGQPWAYDNQGGPIGVMVLWTSAGRLSDLELGWVTEEPPSDLPDPTLIRH